MKVRWERIESGEEEIVVRSKERTAAIDEMISRISREEPKLCGVLEESGQSTMLTIRELLYFESVDGKLYAYATSQVYRIKLKLEEVAMKYSNMGFVQCSRTMVINLYRIEHLETLPGAKILATMKNGEKVLITRKYSGYVREYLKRGSRA